MAVVRKVCLDCGRVETSPGPPDKEPSTTHGLCDECYQRWLARDSELTRWAFKENEKGGEQDA